LFDQGDVDRTVRSVIAAALGKNRDVVFPSPKRNEAMYRINNHGWRGGVSEGRVDHAGA
jgi:hypothetical protein